MVMLHVCLRLLGYSQARVFSDIPPRCTREMVDEDGNAPSLAGCKPAVQTSTLQALVRPWNVGAGSLPVT